MFYAAKIDVVFWFKQDIYVYLCKPKASLRTVNNTLTEKRKAATFYRNCLILR